MCWIEPKNKTDFKNFCTTTTTSKSSNLHSSDVSGSSTKIKLQTFEISLLDNVPNNLVGCVIQKRKGTYIPIFFTQHHFQNRYLTYQPLQKDDQFPDEKKASLLRINHQSQKQKKVGPEVKNTRSSREVRSW